MFPILLLYFESNAVVIVLTLNETNSLILIL
jgi:hypothetical protein